MTKFIDFEAGGTPEELGSESFDIVIVGGGAAGITIARQLSDRGIRILLLESGGLDEDAPHEELNAVEVTGELLGGAMQKTRAEHHGPQTKYWAGSRQGFGVRCRVLGGSTSAWAGKVAPFDDIDFEERPWIPHSGWPIDRAELAPYVDRAVAELDLGPVLSSEDFWLRNAAHKPDQVSKLQSFTSFFWQFARSRLHLTDVMRFGAEFRSESHRDVTVVLNATVVAIENRDGRVTGVRVCASSGVGTSTIIASRHVVLAAGAIENARLLLASKNDLGRALANERDVVGRYLTDHPSISLGSFEPEYQHKAAAVLGFFALREDYRAFLYSHGLALRPQLQRELELPNMAVFALLKMAQDDPLIAVTRLAKRQSRSVLADLASVCANLGFVATAIGRKLVEYRKIPIRLRRALTDIAVAVNPNFVAGDYQSGGRGRRLEAVTLNIICEQPPRPHNRVTLSTTTDRLGLPLPCVAWSVDADTRRDVRAAALRLRDELDQAGIRGFRLRPEIYAGDLDELPIIDMAHTAGTTRMGVDPATSVVDRNCRAHEVEGLYVAGASVFPTSGHANPTMMIIALAMRLADHLARQVTIDRLAELAGVRAGDAQRPLILVTGAAGNLGNEVVGLLVGRGFRVRGTFRKSLPTIGGVDWVQVDLADPALEPARIEAIVQGASGVIHLAASLSNVAEMEATNVTNLRRLVEACLGSHIGYFSQASSMVVYGSPRERLVTEQSAVIDTSRPIRKQYLAEPYMRTYAQTKVRGEQVLREFSDRIYVDVCRIAVAQPPEFLDQAFRWSRRRALFSTYRNSHFISSRDTARAMVYLMERNLSKQPGFEIYNICDENSPTFEDHIRASGRRVGFHIPLVFDVLKGVVIGRTFALRLPMGIFRLSNKKLKAAGFDL